MDGSLWRQSIGTDEARRAHACRRRLRLPARRRADGKRVVFTRYDGKGDRALAARPRNPVSEQALTAGGAVNVEPRISPDGRRLAWVSTTGNGPLQPENRRPLAGRARERALPRRAAREPDRPLLLLDARSLDQPVVVAGREARLLRRQCGDRLGHGRSAPSPSTARRRRRPNASSRHELETTWARVRKSAPDGQRILFSSYHGGQWHQLWLTTTEGTAPLPLTFGEFDRRNARWSPDGKRIAYISNEGGNTSLVVQESSAARDRRSSRSCCGARQTPAVRRDPAASMTQRPARLPRAWPCSAATGAGTRPTMPGCTPTTASTARSSRAKSHYFHCAAGRSACEVTVPAGKATIQVQARLPQEARDRSSASPGRRDDGARSPPAGQRPAARSSVASARADLHVHMNYGGHYRSTPETCSRSRTPRTSTSSTT